MFLVTCTLGSKTIYERLPNTKRPPGRERLDELCGENAIHGAKVIACAERRFTPSSRWVRASNAFPGRQEARTSSTCSTTPTISASSERTASMCFTSLCQAGRAGFTPEHCCTTDGLLQCPARRSIRMCPEHQPSIHAQGCAEARGQKESMALPPMAYLFS